MRVAAHRITTAVTNRMRTRRAAVPAMSWIRSHDSPSTNPIPVQATAHAIVAGTSKRTKRRYGMADAPARKGTAMRVGVESRPSTMAQEPRLSMNARAPAMGPPKKRCRGPHPRK